MKHTHLFSKVVAVLLIFAWFFVPFQGRLQFNVGNREIVFESHVPLAYAGSNAYSTAGTSTFIVPPGITTLTIKVWGAGGGQGETGGNNNADGGGGGGGGFAQGNLTVTGGQTLTVIVGALGAGGSDGANDDAGGGGGGFSGIWNGTKYILIAGGGGGGGSGANGASERGGGGGGGGGADGLIGVVGTDATCAAGGPGSPGNGATSTLSAGQGGAGCSTGTNGQNGSGTTGGKGDSGGGGAGGVPSGGAGGLGGSGSGGGGGGGAGEFGGGGGENGVSEGGGGGGGGSGTTTTLTTVTTAQGTSGSGSTAGTVAQSSDVDWVTPAGNGGGGDKSASAAGTDGSAGRVVINWTDKGFEQAAYRWYTNKNSTAAGTSSPINTPTIAPQQGTAFRLRLLIHNASTTIVASGTTTLLQFAQRSGTCDTSFSGESWTTITPSTAIGYFNNSTPADDTALTANLQDPRHASSTGAGISDDVVNQTYNDGDVNNTFSNSVAAIPWGNDGLWDFSLVDNSATPGTSYCFRAVQNGGGVLDSYKVVPEIRTEGRTHVRLRGQIRLRNVRLR